MNILWLVMGRYRFMIKYLNISYLHVIGEHDMDELYDIKDFKDEAKCEYHLHCTLYNSDALSEEIQMRMCGMGKKMDENYVPMVPIPDNPKPTENYFFNNPELDQMECESFQYFKLAHFVSDLEEIRFTMKRVFKKHGMPNWL